MWACLAFLGDTQVFSRAGKRARSIIPMSMKDILKQKNQIISEQTKEIKRLKKIVRSLKANIYVAEALGIISAELSDALSKP